MLSRSDAKILRTVSRFGTHIAYQTISPVARRMRMAADLVGNVPKSSFPRDGRAAMWNLDPKTLIALFTIIQSAGIGSAYLVRSGAAARLGLKPSTLESRMRKLGISRPS